MNGQKELISYSAKETIFFGMNYAASLKVNEVTGLFGHLGSGKTQFVKGVCNYFKVTDTVNSPTFVIVNEYSGINQDQSLININHFDLYRIKSIKELKDIGIESYVNNTSICLIEWAELADEYFKGNLKKVYFEHGEKENERILKFI